MTPRRKSFIILGVFLASLFLQGIRWHLFDMVDSNLWGNHAEYFLRDDPRAYDRMLAYGYGGPVVEGTIAIRAVTGLPSDLATMAFVTLFNSAAAALAAALALMLTGSVAWALTVPAILSFNWLFYYATPPSGIAFTLVPLLFLMSWLVFQRPAGRTWIAWSALAGLLGAVRPDIGGLSALVLYAALWPKLSLRTRILSPIVASAAFFAGDPFMWAHPVGHLYGILEKFTFHYVDFRPIILPLSAFAAVSSLSVVSVGLILLWRLAFREDESLVPRRLLIALAAMTAITCAVMFSSKIQVERYVIPLFMSWELLLPLYVISLFQKAGRARHILFLVGLFYLYELVFFVTDYFIFTR